MQVVYEDNHIIIVSKRSGEIVQGDKTGDEPLSETVNLMTGRHHQIRCQLAKMGCPIKGDLKYGSPRSNADGSISLLSHRVEFVHPVSKETIVAEAPLPDDNLWRAIAP